MPTINDILNKKKPDVVQNNTNDNPSGSRGERAPITNTPQGVQAPQQKPVEKVQGLETKHMKPLPTATAPKVYTPTATEIVEEVTEQTTTPANTEKPVANTSETYGTPKPQKPQPSGEPEEEKVSYDLKGLMAAIPKGETEEEKKARLKREKRQAVMATLADGFAAFHNAYANARGTKPMPNLGNNASKLQQRLYKEDQDRKAEGWKRLNAKMHMDQMEDTRNWRQVQAEISNKREERLNKKLELDKEKNDSYRKYQESLANKNNEQAAYWKAKWQALEDGKDLDVALKEAKVATERARAGQASSAANLNNVRAENVGNGVGEYTTETEVHRDQFGNITGRTTRRTKGANGSGTSTPASPAKPANNGKKRNPMDSANETPKNNGKKKNPMN